MVDDQDELLNSTHPYYMPALNRLLGEGGTRLSSFFSSTPVCCPARVALLTGQYAHCTNVTDNTYPAGAFQKFYEQRLEEDWLPGWLQDAGYNTYHIGKFLNGYRYPLPFGVPDGYSPKGWTHFDALVGASMYWFTNSCFALNGGPQQCWNGPKDYQTDIIRDKAIAQIRQAARQPNPFFLYLTPAAPHREQDPVDMVWIDPRPANRHARLFKDDNITLPRGDNWLVADPNMRSDVPMTPKRMRGMEDLYLARLRSMRSVDELLDDVVDELGRQGLLDNTHIIFTSDNGYHIGAFAFVDGKVLPIEEDVRVPFYMRGPGVPAGATLSYQGNLIDIAPTIMALAGLTIPSIVNGLPLPVLPPLYGPYLRELQRSTPAINPSADAVLWWRRDTVLLEGWRSGSADDEITPDGAESPRVYKSVRVCTDYRVFPDSGTRPELQRGAYAPGPPCYKYIAWCEAQARELFDLSTDPYEVRDRLADAAPAVLDRLDAIMSALAHCSGLDCRNPYTLLHPGLPVWNFTAAMDPKYDARYRNLAKFQFVRCLPTYVIINERTWTRP